MAKSREAMILHRVREKDIEEREMARGRASGSASTLGIFTLYILLHYVSGTRYFPVQHFTCPGSYLKTMIQTLSVSKLNYRQLKKGTK